MVIIVSEELAALARAENMNPVQITTIKRGQTAFFRGTHTTMTSAFESARNTLDAALLDAFMVEDFWDLPPRAREYRSHMISIMRARIQSECDHRHWHNFEDGSGGKCQDCEASEIRW